MNSADGIADLRAAIERQHGGKAKFVHDEHVKETWEGKTVWDGIVSVFELSDHPLSKRAYAWSEPIEGSKNRRFFAVLHVEHVDSPLRAVRATIVERQRRK